MTFSPSEFAERLLALANTPRRLSRRGLGHTGPSIREEALARALAEAVRALGLVMERVEDGDIQLPLEPPALRQTIGEVVRALAAVARVAQAMEKETKG